MSIKRIVIFCISLGAIFLFTAYSVSAEETESQVDHSTMDHSAQEEVDHSKMDHSAPEEVDHSKMDHSAPEEVDHNQMDHSQHDMGDTTNMHHQHEAGMLMFEYRFMRMTMGGLLDGTNNVSTQDISGAMMGMMGAPATKDPGKAYMMAPTSMTMDMHMFMLMKGYSDDLDFMVMFNYLSNSMDMVMHMSMMGMPMPDMTSSMDTSGIGDTVVSAMYKADLAWTITLGVSLPTGSIDQEVMMMGATRQAPYPMQLGSGSIDLIPAISYNNASDVASWGWEAEYTYRTGKNDNDYQFGNHMEISGWYKYDVRPKTQISARVAYSLLQTIEGADSKIMMKQMSPTFDPDAQGGARTDLFLGAHHALNSGHILGAELGVPLVQDLNGPQMETDSTISFYYQFML